MPQNIHEDYSHLGTGELWIRRRGQAVPMRPIGNARALNFSIEQNSITQPEFRSPGGGERNAIERITSVTATIEVFDLSPENIAIALYGDSTRIAASDSQKREEEVASYKGGLIPLDLTNPSDVVVEPVGVGDPYTAGADYEVRTGGIFIPDDSAIPDATNGEPNIVISYHHGAHYMVEALTNSGFEFEASFRGYNEARAKHFAVDMWRMRFTPTDNLAWVGDEFAVLALNPRLLSDTSRPAGKSQFFRPVIEE